MKLMSFAAVAAFALAAVPASAVTTVFSGQDDGVGPGGSFVNSLAAEAAFKAAAGAYGAVKTETFESATVGAHGNVNLADMVITTASPFYGAGISGVNNTTLGTLYGFNTTVGGSQWYGFPDFSPASATISFKGATNSAGLWITGIQAEFTASVVLELLDGTQEVFNIPLNSAGGAQFFGIVSDSAFTKVSLVQTSWPGYADAFGIDDISYNVVPEPATWAMLIAGFGLVGAAARRRRGVARTAA